MTNPEAYALAVTHELMIGPQGGTFQTFRGAELPGRRYAAAHYLLPENLVDGSTVDRVGAGGGSAARARACIHGSRAT
jgi:hypothetical protein